MRAAPTLGGLGVLVFLLGRAAPVCAQATVSLRHQDVHSTWTERATSALGIFAFMGLAWLMSSDRRRVPYRVIGWGLVLQLLFGLFAIKTRAGLALFSAGLLALAIWLLRYDIARRNAQQKGLVRFIALCLLSG